jgi:hypothetical protein
MLVCGKEYIKDNVALAGGTQTLAGGKRVERVFLFLDHPALLNELECQYRETGTLCQ